MAERDPRNVPVIGLYEQPVLTLDPGTHTAPITRADVDADGAFAVTGSHDRTVRVWSARTGEWQRTIRLPRGPGHVGTVYAVAISPDGALVAAGGWTRLSESDPQEQIYLFARKTGALARRIEGLLEVVDHLAFSPDGSHLAATLGGANGLRVYGRDAGWAETARDDDYGDRSYGAAFAADGRLATTSFDGHVRLYDRTFRRVATRRAAGGTRPFGIAFDPNGDILAVGYDDGTAVSLFDGRALNPLAGPDTSGIDNGDLSKVAWSGATLYAGGKYWSGDGWPVVAWSDSGAGERRELAAGDSTLMSLRPLPDGGLLVGAADPYLAVLAADGAPRWQQRPKQANLRDQNWTLGVSADGNLVEFGYERWGKAPARFDVASLALGLDRPEDGRTAPPAQAGLKVEGWKNTSRPTLDGKPLALDPYEISRSLAVHPDGARFVLGTSWWLRAIDAAGEELWRKPVPGEVWAVNLTADGRLAVAAHADGTIRWHRMDDGGELLAFFPLADRTNWVAWTPEGFYAATPGAHGVLRWHVNHGWDEPAEAIPVSEIKKSRRPKVLPLILQEMDIVRALGLAELQEYRHAVQMRTHSTAPPGARLHVLAMGVSDYGEQAKHLRLSFAHQDARDVASALENTQVSLYAEVSMQKLENADVTRVGVLSALKAMREKMAQREPDRDLAVVLFSGHGAIVDENFYLLTHGVDTTTEAHIKATALSLGEFRNELHKLAEHGRVLVLLDACRSGAATSDGTRLPMNADTLREALRRSNVALLTSSSADETSREDERWSNGAFTEVFLEALNRADSNRDGLIGITDLAEYLTANVPRLTENKQTPSIEVRFQSDVFVTGL